MKRKVVYAVDSQSSHPNWALDYSATHTDVFCCRTRAVDTAYGPLIYGLGAKIRYIFCMLNHFWHAIVFLMESVLFLKWYKFYMLPIHMCHYLTNSFWIQRFSLYGYLVTLNVYTIYICVEKIELFNHEANQLHYSIRKPN